jgi:hypothetical protein
MSVIAINGLDGTKEVKSSYFVPQLNRPFKQCNASKPMIYKSEPIAPPLLNSAIDYSTRRNVLPCKGITHHVLRRPTLPNAGSMVPPTGIARGEKPGLAYLPEKPLTMPIMPFSNPVYSGFNNPLGAPN